MAKFSFFVLCVVLAAWKTASGILERCPDGYTNHLDSCYAYFEDSKNFEGARAACFDDGGYLVEVNSAEENAFIVALKGDNGVYAWIGLEDKASNGVFTYAKSGDAPDYTAWNSGEPNNVDPVAEDCVELLNNGLWNDQNCGDVSDYFCERKACGEGFAYFQGSCYMFGPVNATFEEAEDICLSEGGFLADIENAEVNDFLVGLRALDGTDDAAFFGLTDIATEGKFVWMRNSEEPTYTNWYDNEPNDAAGEDCAEMWGTGYWNDIGCELTRDFFCESALN